MNWQRTHATTHKRLGGSETSRRHAHVMSANDALLSVFTEFTRACPLRSATMSGHTPLPEALAAQRLHSKHFDESCVRTNVQYLVVHTIYSRCDI